MICYIDWIFVVFAVTYSCNILLAFYLILYLRMAMV